MLPRRRSILRIWKGSSLLSSGVTSRTGRMSTWLPGRNATAPPRSTAKPPLTRPKIEPVDLGGVLERLLELVPALLAARLLARQQRLAAAGLETLDVDLDRIADLDLGRVARGRELLQRHAAFGLQPDVDHRLVVLDRDHVAGDHGAFDPIPVEERLVQHGGEVVGRGHRRGGGGLGCGHNQVQMSAPASGLSAAARPTVGVDGGRRQEKQRLRPVGMGCAAPLPRRRRGRSRTRPRCPCRSCRSRMHHPPAAMAQPHAIDRARRAPVGPPEHAHI